MLRDGALEAVDITTGATDGMRTVVTGGALAAGAAVVTDAAGVK